MMIYLQKRVIDQNGRSPSSTENSKIRCGMTGNRTFASWVNYVPGCWQHGWRRAGREGMALDRGSPALRAWASNFSLRGQRKVTKRKATPANPLASPVPSGQSQHRTGRRRRHFGLRHPWLRPKPASNILVLAPNRGRAVLALTRFGPCPLRLRHHP